MNLTDRALLCFEFLFTETTFVPKKTSFLPSAWPQDFDTCQSGRKNCPQFTFPALAVEKSSQKMAPKDVKLIYLEGRGRAEVARMLLVSYVTMADTRIPTL